MGYPCKKHSNVHDGDDKCELPRFPPGMRKKEKFEFRCLQLFHKKSPLSVNSSYNYLARNDRASR